MKKQVLFAFIGIALVSTGPAAIAGDELNIYSSRHYDTDDALYAEFTQLSGVKVNRIEARDDELIERMKAEGANSPADVMIAVDAGRLWRAQQIGLLQPVRSNRLEVAIPTHLRDPGGYWFGFSKRARVLAYNKAKVDPAELSSYEALSDAKWKGRILVRSSTNIYNQSLVGAFIAAHGEAATENWVRGLVANFARPPQGGDTDQLRALGTGEGDIAIVNTYYIARLAKSAKAEDKAVIDKLGVFFPTLGQGGTHVNISGAGVAAHAPNKANAIRFLEFLATPSAQALFANANLEYPAIPEAEIEPVLAAFGVLAEDRVNAGIFGQNNETALKLMDRARWK